MSVISYLVNKKNETLFELGKGWDWDETLDIFKIDKTEELLNKGIFDEEIPYTNCYLMKDKELLRLCLEERFSLMIFDKIERKSHPSLPLGKSTTHEAQTHQLRCGWVVHEE